MRRRCHCNKVAFNVCVCNRLNKKRRWNRTWNDEIFNFWVGLAPFKMYSFMIVVVFFVVRFICLFIDGIIYFFLFIFNVRYLYDNNVVFFSNTDNGAIFIIFRIKFFEWLLIIDQATVVADERYCWKVLHLLTKTHLHWLVKTLEIALVLFLFFFPCLITNKWNIIVYFFNVTLLFFCF